MAPSWAAPIWNEARVRSERFRNSSARVLPCSSGAHGIGPEIRRLIEKRLQFLDGPVLGAGEVSHGPFCF